MEHKIAQFESHVSKIFNLLRKDVSGKGCVNVDARIAGDVIFVKMRVEYTHLEKRLLSFICADHDTEANYVKVYREPLVEMLDQCIQGLVPTIHVIDCNLRTNVPQGYIYATIDLSHNLEKMIRDGSVDVPKGCAISLKTNG